MKVLEEGLFSTSDYDQRVKWWLMFVPSASVGHAGDESPRWGGLTRVGCISLFLECQKGSKQVAVALGLLHSSQT